MRRAASHSQFSKAPMSRCGWSLRLIRGGYTALSPVQLVQFKTVPLVDPTSGSLVAMQMAIVARNSQPEKPDPTTNACNTTTTYPGWTGGTLDLSGKLGLAVADDWRCYRYKTFIVTVPLRNVIWKP